MTKPLYVQAFERFKKDSGDPLTAYVAFGLYIDTECKWAATQTSWPDGEKYKHYHDSTIPVSIEAHNEKAEAVLLEFADKIVEGEHNKFLAAALDSYKEAAAKSEKGFWQGVGEALVGALAWSILLIVVSIIFQRVGVDVLEVYEKAAGRKIERAEPQKAQQPANCGPAHNQPC
jgi:hypothetical protein